VHQSPAGVDQVDIDAALHTLDEIRHIPMTWIEVTERVGHADDRACERIVGMTHGLDEILAQE
jgi:hypothetical protein